MKNCLTIAGSDCSGGAGIQADIKTFCANGAYAMSVITSVVAENTTGVSEIYDLPIKIIDSQIDSIFEDIAVDGVKIGMIKSCNIMDSVAYKLACYKPKFIVTDPVMSAKDGKALMDTYALKTLRNKIIPLSTVITPNIQEAEVIADMKITDTVSIMKVAEKIFNMGAKNVLIKGGHLEGMPCDILFDGKKFFKYTSKRINTKNTHGTGCTLSSAITVFLAQGFSPYESVLKAKKYIYNTIENSLEIGKGNGPLNHFYEYYNMKGFE